MLKITETLPISFITVAAAVAAVVVDVAAAVAVVDVVAAAATFGIGRSIFERLLRLFSLFLAAAAAFLARNF